MRRSTSGHSDQLVSHQDSERLIAAVEAGVSNPQAGIFGPESITWKINRESALFLGAGRAALLQLAHPWVATALQQHSNLMHQPIKRFHNTFRIVFTLVFGSLDQAVAGARRLYRTHAYVQGEMEEAVAGYARGSHYEANEIGALRWVYATLLESAVLAYESVLPKLTTEELCGYYNESKKMAALFGLPQAVLPEDWPAFLAYCRQMEQSNALGVSTQARAMAQSLLAGTGAWIRIPQWYKALTTTLLPERLRAEFQLPFGESVQSSAENARRWLPRIYGHLPAAVRFVGPWHEAQARIGGRSPSLTAQAGNRFWIGQTRMPFA